MTLTRQQRIALLRVCLRAFPDTVAHDYIVRARHPSLPVFFSHGTVQHAYRQLRRQVVPTLPASDPAILVPYAGMWLGIEADGYTHS